MGQSRWNTLSSYPYSMLHSVVSACFLSIWLKLVYKIAQWEREGDTTVPTLLQQSDTGCSSICCR